jgi:4-diphosphocytidyl-2-C-methyl-D-erythritol kinase
MRIQRLSNCIEIDCPAKLNLFLEVLGKRPDGYHEIATLMCPVSLCDRLVVERSSQSDITMELVLPPGASEQDAAWNIPADDTNLIIRGLRQLQSSLGTSQGCHIRLEKRIPAAAGLAGGSSDAAAAVCAGLLLWKRWNRDLALSVCASLGSDIPFFLGDGNHIGLAVATGRGEKIQLLSCDPSLEFLVTHPPVGCSTAEVYRRLELPKHPKSPTSVIAACMSGDTQKLGTELYNALQFPAAGLTEWIDRQLSIFRRAGLEYCMMTGSGSSCFAMFAEPAARVERIEDVGAAAQQAGIRRLFHVTNHTAPSIESQI